MPTPIGGNWKPVWRDAVWGPVWQPTVAVIASKIYRAVIRGGHAIEAVIRGGHALGATVRGGHALDATIRGED